VSTQDLIFYAFLIPLSFYAGKWWTERLMYIMLLLKDIYACCFYQCLGFCTKKDKGGEKDKEVPIFKVKTNVVFLGNTFISHIKAKRIKHV
jgi:hypothetical protein